MLVFDDSSKKFLILKVFEGSTFEISRVKLSLTDSILLNETFTEVVFGDFIFALKRKNVELFDIHITQNMMLAE